MKQPNVAKHAFFYLTCFLALGFVAFAIGSFCFQIINYYFPEEYAFGAYESFWQQGVIKFAISSLIVSAPVFYFLSRMINRSLSKKDLDQDSAVRRWLTYLVMFITVSVVLADLIATIYQFLDGELTTRFLLKVLTILVISGGIFVYYLTDMKNENEDSRTAKNNRWSVAFWVCVLVPFVWWLAIMENPRVVRLRKIDQETAQMLQGILHQVTSYYQNERRLPHSFSDLSSPPYRSLTAEEITYSAVSDREYELCTKFRRDNQKDQDYNRIHGVYWSHPKGKKCFVLTVPKLEEDPSLEGIELAVMENPQVVRLRKIDQETEAMLQSMMYQVEKYYYQDENDEGIPPSFSGLDSTKYFVPAESRMQEKEITYSTVSDWEYEVCAKFQRDNRKDHIDDMIYNGNWSHPMGKGCFVVTIGLTEFPSIHGVNSVSQ